MKKISHGGLNPLRVSGKPGLCLKNVVVLLSENIKKAYPPSIRGLQPRTGRGNADKTGEINEYVFKRI